MAGIDTFVINYDPLERRLRFAILKSTGVKVGVHDSEPLKEYENRDGIFTLAESRDKLFSFIKDNFDGKEEIALRVEVTPFGFDKYGAEFDYFQQAVDRFNKTSEIRINLAFDIDKVENEVAASSSVEVSSNIEASSQEDNNNTKPLKIAVVGKMMSGKTELIEGLLKHKGAQYSRPSETSGIIQYRDEINGLEIYELQGIAFGREHVNAARNMLEHLITEAGVSVVLYCVNASIGKIEDAERDLIVDIKGKYPALAVYAVITCSVEEEAAHELADKISKLTKHTKVMITLAKEIKTSVGYLEPFGLEEVSQAIIGGTL